MVTAIIQARTGSVRLPFKVLKEIEGTPVIKLIHDRVILSKVDNIIVATTSDSMKLVCYCFGMCEVFVGSESDVLDRFHKVTALNDPDDIIVRITGDCPLIDPNIIDEMLDDYSTGYMYNYLDGFDVEIFTKRMLDIAHKQATKPEEREHVTLYMRNRMLNMPFRRYKLDRHLSLDTLEDLELIRVIYKSKGLGLRFQDVKEYFNENR